MNVLLVTERFPPQRGGVAVSAWRHAAGLALRVGRLDVVHLTADHEPGMVSEARAERCRVYTVGRAPREDESLQLLETVIRSLHAREPYDLLHGFYAVPSGAVAVVAARMLGLPSVVSVRGNDVERGIYQGPRGALLLWALENADRVLTVSRDLARRVAVLARRDDVTFIPNAVDPDVFHPEPPDPRVLRHLPTRRPIVGFSGEMRLKKGMQALLSAVEETPEMELLLIGGVRKDERHAFEHWQARSTAAAARVHEVPYERDRGHLRALYNACELMVFPSLWEGMPNGVLEAMACARPVLASAVGGVLDLIEDGKTGWLLPPDRLPELAPRIRELLSRSSAERDAIGQAARAQVMTHHRPQQEVERILEVYRGLLRAD